MEKSSALRTPHMKTLLVALLIGGCGWMIFNRTELPASYAQSSDQFDKQFDTLVRDDFFAGMTGGAEKLNRAMKNAEEVLARNPKHVQALVWHGGGMIARASMAYRKGDYKLGDELWKKGLNEMNQAVALAPDRIDVIIGRSATIIGLAQAGWDATDKEARELLESALLGYEKVYQAQRSYFSKISEHSRGELLFGLASGWSILGEQNKAQFYLGRVIKETKGSSYEEEAQKWIGKRQVIEHDCRGCH
jgi:tetratricopeptide (TPR) repeat protein